MISWFYATSGYLDENYQTEKKTKWIDLRPWATTSLITLKIVLVQSLWHSCGKTFDFALHSCFHSPSILCGWITPHHLDVPTKYRPTAQKHCAQILRMRTRLQKGDVNYDYNVTHTWNPHQRWVFCTRNNHCNDFEQRIMFDERMARCIVQNRHIMLEIISPNHSLLHDRWLPFWLYNKNNEDNVVKWV